MPDLKRLYAAWARSRTEFCVAATNADDEDPVSALLAYDASFPQPWRRVDVRRIISSVTDYRAPGSTKSIYVALSGEGDVYFLDDQVRSEKISGAGLNSDESTGLGAVNCIVQIEDLLYASGIDSQLYRRRLDGWGWLGNDRPKSEPTYDYLSFGDIAGPAHDDIYATASASPTSDSRALTSAEWAEFNRLVAAGNEAGALAISQRAQGSGRTSEGRGFHWDGARWSKLDVPTKSVVRDIYVEAPDKVWFAGTDGLLMRGNARDGFRSMHSSEGLNHMVSFTRFRDTYVCATDYALHHFDGRSLTPLKPRFTTAAVPTPLKVQGVDDVLFYFDYKQGVFRFDGATWDQIPIPPELLDQTFKGLPPRSP